ncbi:ABC transporter A family member 12 (ABC transporter ABCA.12) (AtABCA12) (Putative ABC2 homolog 16) [Durusdinium trenchii]|uniref:ABC transporter A family member 12 (ABC transporter ABCA.12) (AtABCA12) (Putative ABC2 homolog 16) n=1 Tax=Durusdinium trenchii TaxID=1381693 RepID=A0ABP0KR17_9DINO
MADNPLAATKEMLRLRVQPTAAGWQESADDMTSLVQEDDSMSPCFKDLDNTLTVSNTLMPTLSPASLPFRERLRSARPAGDCAGSICWSRMVAAETSEALGVEGGTGASRLVEINSGGVVFFVLLNSPGEHEEAVVLKFCNNRYTLQSEQMAAELARHLGVPGPLSRILLKQHDREEWDQLALHAAEVCPSLADMLEKKVSMLLLQYVPGHNLFDEKEAFQPENLSSACHALGRLFTLDLLLGNADRLPLQSLSWRGNPRNVLFSAGGRCVPIDAAVARRPPKLLVRDMDQKAARLLELALLDRRSCHEVLVEAIRCNDWATKAIEADWLPNEGAWQERYGGPEGKAKATADGAMSSVKAFNEGIKAALAEAVEEQGLLEMMTEVVESWIENFKADLKACQPSPPQLKLSNTVELRDLSKEESKPDAFKERLASWQDLLREKTGVLHQAVQDWAQRKARGGSGFEFRGFLGSSVLNPVADAYELLVRLRQLTSRIKVLHIAGSVSRPADLRPKAPLFLGGATCLCFHLLRKLGATQILNCTDDLPAPSADELGELQWSRLPLMDLEDQDLNENLEKALEIIGKAESLGGAVLVHCHEGKSRSVSVCLAYLMKSGLSLASSLAYVKSKRPMARPNAGFLKQLLAMEQQIFGEQSELPEELTGEVRPPTAGQVQVLGHDITTVEGMEEAYRNLGVCPQVDPLWEHLTGKEHLMFFGRIKGVPEADLSRTVDALLYRLGLDGADANRKTTEYSGGMKRKLSLAIALIGRSPVLFLDEPSAAVDAGAKRHLWKVIQRRGREQTVVVTTHSMEEAEALCDRIAIQDRVGARGEKRSCQEPIGGPHGCIGIGAGASHSFARMAPLRAKYGSGYQLELFSNDRRGARAGAQIANMREGEENLGQQVRGTEIPGITPMTEDISAAK